MKGKKSSKSSCSIGDCCIHDYERMWQCYKYTGRR